MLPFVLVFTVFFLIRGIQKKKIIDYVFAGLFFGLGLHTYIAFRIAPLILVVLLAAFMVNRKRFLATHWKEILAFFAATAIVALPMLVDFAIHPDHFSGRTSEVSRFQSGSQSGSSASHAWEKFRTDSSANSISGATRTGGKIFRLGRNSFPTIGIFFLAGLFYFIYEFFYLLWRRIRAGERSERLILGRAAAFLVFRDDSSRGDQL